MTQDLFIEITGVLEEQRWMWQAQNVGYDSGRRQADRITGRDKGPVPARGPALVCPCGGTRACGLS